MDKNYYQRPVFWWWTLLVVVFSTGLFLRRDHLFLKDVSTADLILFVIPCALLLLPFVNEITAGGVTLKSSLSPLFKEVQETKKELTEVKNEIRTLVSVGQSQRQALSNNIFLPPSDEQLELIRKNLSESLTSFSAKLPEPKKKETAMTPTLESSVDLASIQAGIEREIRRLFSKRVRGDKAQFQTTFGQMAAELTQAGILTNGVLGLINNIYSIANSREELGEAQVQFAQDMGPKLLSVLEAVPA